MSAAVMEGFSAMKIGESSKKPSSICWDGHRRCVSNLGWSFSHVDAKGKPVQPRTFSFLLTLT